METSTEINLISKAMIELNKEIINPKNSAVNPFFKSKYTPLNDILTEVRPLMSKHGLAIIQNTTSENTLIGIQTMILHESGQFIKSDVMYTKSDKDTAQGQGSAITYGRRYQISAMLSIASEDDDDGNGAGPPKKTTPPPPEKPKGNYIKASKAISEATEISKLNGFVDLIKKSTWTDEEDQLLSDLIDSKKKGMA